MSQLMSFVSHISGRNARVSLFQDRIEWQIAGRSWVGPAIVAVCTVGISLLFYRGRATPTQMMLVKAVQGVTTKKSGMQTEVQVVGSGMTLVFRCSSVEAEEFKARVLQLVA